MMWIIWIPIVIFILIFVIRATGNTDIFGSQARREEKESPLDILKRRYANGEITKEEYQERIKKLK
ncbi:SHOCT domain-containing protein [Maribacter polysaccharolyticus]|uniref:SHOCT domain-containing protein n=1 Tax=Maribacter polysaccharolyticus TaxID=3020831 RepID=UPI00237FCE8E|nr:SHOCT domain-containing protein [Maribacter polysaccharolyticus]MDE3744119.1 SHOCT domain-containing protein [Maribacter polysaccharolyticus]